MNRRPQHYEYRDHNKWHLLSEVGGNPLSSNNHRSASAVQIRGNLRIMFSLLQFFVPCQVLPCIQYSYATLFKAADIRFILVFT